MVERAGVALAFESVTVRAGGAVILEDVDLVFNTREINPYGTALGDLMDQLDGFTPDEEVIFVLTTNAIARACGSTTACRG